MSATGLAPNTRLKSAGGWGQPVDRILEHPGNGVVVLGGDEEQAVGCYNRFLKRPHGLRDALGGLDIAVVERKAMNGPDCDLSAVWGQLRSGSEQRRVRGATSQAPGAADQVRHGGIHLALGDSFTGRNSADVFCCEAATGAEASSPQGEPCSLSDLAGSSYGSDHGTRNAAVSILARLTVHGESVSQSAGPERATAAR